MCKQAANIFTLMFNEDLKNVPHEKIRDSPESFGFFWRQQTHVQFVLNRIVTHLLNHKWVFVFFTKTSAI